MNRAIVRYVAQADWLGTVFGSHLSLLLIRWTVCVNVDVMWLI